MLSSAKIGTGLLFRTRRSASGSPAAAGCSTSSRPKPASASIRSSATSALDAPFASGRGSGVGWTRRDDGAEVVLVVGRADLHLEDPPPGGRARAPLDLEWVPPVRGSTRSASGRRTGPRGATTRGAALLPGEVEARRLDRRARRAEAGCSASSSTRHGLDRLVVVRGRLAETDAPAVLDPRRDVPPRRRSCRGGGERVAEAEREHLPRADHRHALWFCST